MVAIREQASREARRFWGAVQFEAIDATFDRETLARVLSGLQRDAALASRGYVGAYVSSELERRIDAPPVDPEAFSGEALGQDLVEALTGPVITAKIAIGDGRADEAMELGLNRLLRFAELSADTAARASLSEAIRADDRIRGWRRAVRGTCGACLGAATGDLAGDSETMDVHPGCQCVSEPEVVGVRQRFPRPSGAQLFAAMELVRQDEILGPERAELVRTGAVELADLVDHSPMKHDDDFITTAPVEALT